MKTKSKPERIAPSIEKEVILNNLAHIIYQRTFAWGEKYSLVKREDKLKENTRYSETARKIAKILDTHSFSGHDQAVRDLMEAVINEEIPKSKKELTVAITYDLGIIVVPLTNPNGHLYPIGEPVLITKPEGIGITSEANLNVSSKLPNNSKTAIRPATRNEVQQLLEDLLKKTGTDFNTLMAAFFLGNIK